MEKDKFDSWLMVLFDYGKKSTDDLMKYQNELEDLVNSSGLGEVDGHEIATNLKDGIYWIVCKNTLQVFDLIKDSLTRTTLVDVREVKKRDSNEEKYLTIFKHE